MCLLLTLSATAYSQPSTHINPADTTRIYGVPQWQFDRLVNEALAGRACDAAYRAYIETMTKEILAKKSLEKAFDEKSKESVDRLDALDEMKKAVTAADASARLWEKEARKQKRLKVGTMILFGVVVAVHFIAKALSGS